MDEPLVVIYCVNTFVNMDALAEYVLILPVIASKLPEYNGFIV
jgi:hypothetical protein